MSAKVLRVKPETTMFAVLALILAARIVTRDGVKGNDFARGGDGDDMMN